MRSDPSRPSREAPQAPRDDGVYGFCALACVTTWVLAVPAARAWMRHEAPPSYAVACAGLSAFGPTLAALLVAGRRRELRQVFGRWRTKPVWIVCALLAPLLVNTLAVALRAVAGGHPTRWFYLPSTPEDVAALVVFPLGEEFGWRGFAYPRLVTRHGLVRGSLLLGAVWGLWHLSYAVTPQAAGLDVSQFGMVLVELPLHSLLIAWVLERSNRSMAVAIASHAGAHLDHIERVPLTEIGLHAAHLTVLAIVATLAAVSLSKRAASPPDPPPKGEEGLPARA
jgi:uncharacterized protein